VCVCVCVCVVANACWSTLCVRVHFKKECAYTKRKCAGGRNVERVWERKDQGEVLLFFYTIFSIFFIIFLFSEEADPTRLIIMMYIHYLF
jgi:hypothetical protein